MFILFVLFTFLYLTARKIAVDTYENRGKTPALWNFITLLYFCIFTMVQIKSNFRISKEICGSIQYNSVLFWTLLPNIIIFGSLFAILRYLPGWKAPFANTIGYGFLQLSGLKALLNKILKSKISDSGETTANKPLAKLLELVYKDPTDIINEISPNNWDEWMEKTPINKLFKEGVIGKKPPSPDERELFGYVVQRDLIAEAVWLLLTGAFVGGLQQSSLANLRCIRPSGKIKAENIKWEDKEKEKEEKRATDKQKLYYIDE